MQCAWRVFFPSDLYVGPWLELSREVGGARCPQTSYFRVQMVAESAEAAKKWLYEKKLFSVQSWFHYKIGSLVSIDLKRPNYKSKMSFKRVKAGKYVLVFIEYIGGLVHFKLRFRKHLSSPYIWQLLSTSSEFFFLFCQKLLNGRIHKDRDPAKQNLFRWPCPLPSDRAIPVLWQKLESNV